MSWPSYAIIVLLGIFTVISVIAELGAYPTLAPWRSTLTEYMVRGPLAKLQRGAYVAMILVMLTFLVIPGAAFETVWRAALIVSAVALVGTILTAGLAVGVARMTLGRAVHEFCAGIAFTSGFAAQAAYFGANPRVLIVGAALVTSFLLSRFRVSDTALEEKLALAWLLAGAFVIALFPSAPGGI